MKLQDLLSQYQQEWDDDVLFEMANVHSNIHHIDNVVIWVGLANKQHGLRVKVSNIKDRFSVEDHFVVMMPSLQYDHNQVANWIKPHMNQIFDWIKLNQPLLYSYECGEISDTKQFLDQLVGL